MRVSAFLFLPCAALAYLVKDTLQCIPRRTFSASFSSFAFTYLNLSKIAERECSALGTGRWRQGAGRQRSDSPISLPELSRSYSGPLLACAPMQTESANSTREELVHNCSS